MTKRLTLGFSPCPNDTAMFYGLLHDIAPLVGVEFQFELLDIEALNREALREPPAFDVTKLSLPALARCTEHYSILSAGAALGRGCGPLVVRRDEPGNTQSPRTLGAIGGCRVAIPGENTTAFLLLRIFAPSDITPLPMRFDEIMPAVADGRADAGLIIHESRFTFRDHGLAAVADLGELWETATDLPLPLGIIAARRSLDPELVAGVEGALRRSVESARADLTPGWPWIKAHAQEMSEDVCRRHIELYVNDYSVDLGEVGRSAIDELLRRGRAVGHLPVTDTPWRES